MTKLIKYIKKNSKKLIFLLFFIIFINYPFINYLILIFKKLKLISQFYIFKYYLLNLTLNASNALLMQSFASTEFPVLKISTFLFSNCLYTDKKCFNSSNI